MSYGAVIVFLLSTAALAQSSGPFIATAVGLGIRGFDGDGGSATAARLAFPAGIAFDKVGNLYVADSLNNRIRRVTPQGTITTVAGSATSGFGGDGGPATSARLAQPQAVAIDAAGNLFIADTQNNRIRRVSITGTITTVVGSGVCSVTGPRGGYSGDGGPSSAAQISCPTGVAIDSSGNLFIADSQNNRIRKINSAGIITTVAGSGDLNPTVGLGDGGPAVAARLRIPLGVTADRAGNLFIADSQNNRIRRVAVDGTINTIAGGDAGGSASISYPRGVAVDELGNLYVAEDQSNYVRKVEPNGRVSILAGRGTSNFSGDGGVAISGELAQPFAVAVDLDGRVYIADYSNHRVRVVSYASSISTTGIVNAASGIGGGVAPGEFLAIYGSGLGPASPLVANGVSQELATSSVTFNGVKAFMAFTSSGQINAIAPYGIERSATVDVQVAYLGLSGNRVTLPVIRASPGIFTLDGSGRGQAVVVNQDGTFNSAANPAARGTIISFWATGQGQTNPVGVDGQTPQFPNLPVPALPTTVSIGNVTVPQADLLFAGLVYSGVLQVNVRVPMSIQPGPLTELLLRVGSNVSLQGVTLPAVTVAVR